MFDALRRAEAERRRKTSNFEEAPSPPEAMEPVDRSARKEPKPLDFEPTVPVPVHPSANGSDPFEGDMFREMGILRNAIESQIGEKRKRVLMFTSALHEEGVTTLALSYTRLLAMHGGERVLLLEMNGRSPSLAWKLGLTGREGVTHYFTEKLTFASIVHQVPDAGFDVVHVGEANPTKIQVNLERVLPRLIEDAHRTHDTVIIDAPPIVVCPETPPISRYADGVVVVVLTGRTKRETVKRSVNLVSQFDGRVLGVVLNRKRYYIPDFLYRRL